MPIVSAFENPRVSCECFVDRLSRNDFRECSTDIQKEHELTIVANGAEEFSTVCSPDLLPELVAGRLLTEGLISAVSDIDELVFSESFSRAEVALRRGFARRSTSFLQDVRPISWDASWIFELARAFSKDSPMHRLTKGSHSCYLANSDTLLKCCEDLGRHNALDKAFGWALFNRVDLSRCIVFTSGRIPTDMMSKIIMASVPIVVSKTVPTDRAVELARIHRVTLICSASESSVDVFNDPCASLRRKSA